MLAMVRMHWAKEDDGGGEADRTDMDLDAPKTGPEKKRSYHGSKIEKKKAHRKARNSIVFPSLTRKRKGPGMSKTKAKAKR